MAKYTVYLGKNKIEYEIDESQKLFPAGSKIKNNVKPDANYLDTALCDIPEPPEDTVKIPNIPFADIPSPLPQIEIPKTVLAALLPCAKKGLFPCPDLRLVETFVMSEEEADECTTDDTLIIPISLNLLYDDDNPDYDFTDDPAVNGIIGYVYIRPFFVSKCCCDAENDEDVIEITVGLYYKVLEPELSLPRIKFPCPDISFETSVGSGNTDSNDSQNDIGKVNLAVTSEVDEEDCRKMLISAGLTFSIPNMIKGLRWIPVSGGGGSCISSKTLVVDRANLVISGGHIQFGPVTSTEDLLYAPIQEERCFNVNEQQEQEVEEPVTGEYTVIGSIDYSESDDEITINWQELKFKFCCGRLVKVENGSSDSVTIPINECDEPEDPPSSEHEVPSSEHETPSHEETLPSHEETPSHEEVTPHEEPPVHEEPPSHEEITPHEETPSQEETPVHEDPPSNEEITPSEDPPSNEEITPIEDPPSNEEITPID